MLELQMPPLHAMTQYKSSGDMQRFYTFLVPQLTTCIKPPPTPATPTH